MTKLGQRFTQIAGCLLLAGSAACGSQVSAPKAHTSVTGGPTAPRPADTRAIAADTRRLAAQQYSVDRHVVGSLPGGRPFYVFHSICTGSADGHCQAVDVFVGNEAVPRWHQQFAGVSALSATGSAFSLRVTGYRPSDPLCCPSGPPRTNTYHWNGTSFSKSPLPAS